LDPEIPEGGQNGMKSVLLVEDDAKLASIMCVFLQKNDFRVGARSIVSLPISLMPWFLILICQA
jgi:hypothetical protein